MNPSVFEVETRPNCCASTTRLTSIHCGDKEGMEVSQKKLNWVSAQIERTCLIESGSGSHAGRYEGADL